MNGSRQELIERYEKFIRDTLSEEGFSSPSESESEEESEEESGESEEEEETRESPTKKRTV